MTISTLHITFDLSIKVSWYTEMSLAGTRNASSNTDRRCGRRDRAEPLTDII